MSAGRAACRLYAILARDGRSAVVFRRGPSRHVCLIRWWLAEDKIEIGQWFRGRIYERRADLSPDGELLVYFAAKYRGPIGSWTAVCRPPYLSALALWPKGDAWGGGGLFETRQHLGLNHSHELTLHPDFSLPPNFTVAPVGPWAGGGEDNPIEHVRLERDGWRLLNSSPSVGGADSVVAKWKDEPLEIYEKQRPSGNQRSAPKLLLRRVLRAVGVRNGPWYDESYVLLDEEQELRRFDQCDWADWQSNGDLLFAKSGCLFRLPSGKLQSKVVDPITGALTVSDLEPLRFNPVPAPPEACKWPKGFGSPHMTRRQRSKHSRNE